MFWKSIHGHHERFHLLQNRPVYLLPVSQHASPLDNRFRPKPSLAEQRVKFV